jgi:hypothetical protein
MVEPVPLEQALFFIGREGRVAILLLWSYKITLS